MGGVKTSFKYMVQDEKQALFAINILADQHLWLEENRVIPDYSNAFFVEMLVDNDWVEYYNEAEDLDWDDVVEVIGETN